LELEDEVSSYAGAANELARPGLEALADADIAEEVDEILAEADAEADDEAGADGERREADEQGGDSVRAYLNTIGKIALLDSEQVIARCKQIEAGLLAEKVLKLRRGEVTVPQLIQNVHDALMPPKTERDRMGEEELALKLGSITLAKEDAAKKLQALKDNEEISNKHLQAVVDDGERAKNDLTNANLRLVIGFARRNQGRGLELLDLIQEGNFGLMHAVEKFDYGKGFRFSTYAARWIKQFIGRAIKSQAKTIRLPEDVGFKLEKYKRDLADVEGRLGGSVEPETVAKELGIPLEKVQEYNLIIEQQRMVSLHTPTDDAGHTLGNFLSDDRDVSPDDAAPAAVDLRTAMAGLTERERQAVYLLHAYDVDAKVVAEALGFSSQHHARLVASRAIAKVRRSAAGEALRASYRAA